jgi:hypothetical protein
LDIIYRPGENEYRRLTADAVVCMGLSTKSLPTTNSSLSSCVRASKRPIAGPEKIAHRRLGEDRYIDASLGKHSTHPSLPRHLINESNSGTNQHHGDNETIYVSPVWQKHGSNEIITGCS